MADHFKQAAEAGKAVSEKAIVAEDVAEVDIAQVNFRAMDQMALGFDRSYRGYKLKKNN